MRKWRWLTLVILGVLLFSLGAGPAVAQSAGKVQVLIGFTHQPGPAEQALVRGVGGEIGYTFSIIPTISARIPETAIAGLLRNPRITHIEADGLAYAVDDTLPWGVDRIDAEVVQASGNTGAGIKIAIVDTGIGPHNDLSVSGGHRYLNNGGIDDSNFTDDNGHGTHCAGIVAALENDYGVIGVAPKADLFAVKVLSSSGSGYYSDIISGIQWCIDNNMQVISMSLGGSSSSIDLKNACDQAYGAGIIVVASAGNEGNRLGIGDTIGYPARYDSVIAVAATDQNDKRARWSSTGPAAELSAPGVNIYSTYLNNSYATMSGTSMACPHVSGVAALVKASEPSLTNLEVRQILRETADDLGTAGWDELYGWGLVDADEAALGSSPPTNNPPVANAGGPYSGTVGVPIPFNGSSSYDPDGNPLTYSWDFGDGNTGSGEYTTHSYADAGVYTVTLTVGDGEATATDTATVTISSTPTFDGVSVGKIVMSTSSRPAGKNTFYWSTATITVVDANGKAAAGVTVYGDWSSLTSDSDSGITSSDGTVTFSSDSVKNTTGTFTITIKQLVTSNGAYNVNVSESISVP